MIHRDIKPENVVVEGGKWGGRVYLIDFGGVQGVSGLGELEGIEGEKGMCLCCLC